MTEQIAGRAPWAVQLSAAQRRELERAAGRGYPQEVCGLLVGREGPRGTAVLRVTQARNLAGERRADRYRLDPDDFLVTDRAARDDGLEIVGVWHTHPDHPARPSRTDREAAWEGWSYLILSVDAGQVSELTAWRLEGGSFVRQPIQIEEDQP